jgi:hypothetical protein
MYSNARTIDIYFHSNMLIEREMIKNILKKQRSEKNFSFKTLFGLLTSERHSFLYSEHVLRTYAPEGHVHLIWKQ